MSDDIVFTTYNEDREITYTLYEGEPLTFGRRHIIHQRPSMENSIDAIKKAVEKTDVAYWDCQHANKGDRERLYCKGVDSCHPEMYVVVVAEYGSARQGNIITSWVMKEISREEGEPSYVKTE